MSAGTEKNRTVCLPERLVIGCCGNSVCFGLLFRESYVKLTACLFLYIGNFFSEKRFKKYPMLRRNREVQIHLSVLLCGYKFTLVKMFFNRCAGSVIVAVEKQKPLRFLAIVQSLFSKHCRHDFLVPAGFLKLRNFFSIKFAAHGIKCVIKCKMTYAAEKLFLKICLGFFVFSIKKREHILEHATCSTRCGNKLNEFHFIVLAIFVPHVYIRGALTLAIF